MRTTFDQFSPYSSLARSSSSRTSLHLPVFAASEIDFLCLMYLLECVVRMQLPGHIGISAIVPFCEVVLTELYFSNTDGFVLVLILCSNRDLKFCPIWRF